MRITLLKAGSLSSLQAGPRSGWRHRGVPAGGAADPLSLALANRLLGNDWDAPAIETTLLGPTLGFDAATSIAVAGASVPLWLNGEPVAMHESLQVRAGDTLAVGAATAGARAYIAIAGGFAADAVLGSRSTELTAGFGGFAGRALKSGDVLSATARAVETASTPAAFRPPMPPARVLRTTMAAETGLLDEAERRRLFSVRWCVGERANRVGIALDGPVLGVASNGRMPSAGVFPGCLQCPPDGTPFLLGVDAGTVGGYPRIAQVARADRHQLGQLRPGDRLLLRAVDYDAAVDALAALHDYWRPWLPEIAAII